MKTTGPALHGRQTTIWPSAVLQADVFVDTGTNNHGENRVLLRQGAVFLFWYNTGMKWDVSTLEKLHATAQEVCASLEKDEEHAVLLTLQGDLGAGKTAFTKELATILGVTEHITSPTFVLAKEYNLQDQEFKTLIHIDAYRLEGDESLRPVGFEELLQNPNNLIVLEWPERVEEGLPAWRNKIQIVLDGDKRTLSYGN